MVQKHSHRYLVLYCTYLYSIICVLASFPSFLIVYCVISQIFQEARRNLPSIIYVPAIAQWWNLVPETLHAVFLSHLCKLDPSAPILLIATADIPYHNLPQEVSWDV